MNRRSILVAATLLLAGAAQAATYQFQVSAKGLTASPAAATPARTYATWSPTDKSADITLTNGDLTAANLPAASWRTLRTTIGKSSGKHVFEITFSGSTPGNAAMAGFGNTATNVGAYPGYNGISASYQTNTGGSPTGYYNRAGVTVSGPLPAAGNGPYMIALDLTAGKGWIATGNVWAQGDPAAGTSPTFTWTPGTTLFPMAAIYQNSALRATLNAGASSFGNTVPTGFSPGWYD